MKSFWLQWLLALQVLVVLSILGPSIVHVDASSRHLLHEGVTPVRLSEDMNSEPVPPGSVLIGESDPTELHQLRLKEQVEVSEILRMYRPRPRLLGADNKVKEKKLPGGKKTPKGAPPPPRNTRRFALPPPPSPPSIPYCPPSPPPRKD